MTPSWHQAVHYRVAYITKQNRNNHCTSMQWLFFGYSLGMDKAYTAFLIRVIEN